MSPLLEDGDHVLIDPTKRPTTGLGWVVVVQDPETPERILVKRIVSRGKTTLAVGSDNPNEGRDSRHFGSLSNKAMLGVVTWCRQRRGAWKAIPPPPPEPSP
jgi:phage repressor protein C with HTH and peptisase S24 domain